MKKAIQQMKKAMDPAEWENYAWVIGRQKRAWERAALSVKAYLAELRKLEEKQERLWEWLKSNRRRRGKAKH